METPVQVAYKALGEGFSHPASVEPHEGFSCVRCQNKGSQNEPCVPLLKLISNKFTDWEHLTDSSSASLVCLPCSWAYSVLDNRLRRILITENSLHLLTSAEASKKLMGIGDPRDTVSIVVPVTGKKHVLPYAKWGTLSYDDGTLQWNEELAKTVSSINYLKKAGLSETSLKSQHHYYPPTAEPALFFYAWGFFERMNPSLLDLMLVLSRVLDDKVMTESFERWAK